MTSPFRLRGLAVNHFMKRVHQFKSGLIVILLQYRHHSAGA